MLAPRSDQPILFRSRPLLSAAVLFAIGIHLDARLGGAAAGVWIVLSGLAVVLGAVLLLGRRKRLVSLRPLALLAVIGLALTSNGALRHATWEASWYAPLVDKAAEAESLEHAFPLLIAGRVKGSPTANDRRLQFTLIVDSLGYDHLVPTEGMAQVTVWWPRMSAQTSPEWPALRPGHRVVVDGLLRALPEPRNPADVDYGAYLRRRGIHAVVSATDRASITVLEYRPSRAERVLSGVRDHVRTSLETHVHGNDSRAVLQALLLADRSDIDPAIRQGFARTGLAHLLAVSGLHVFLVGMVLYGLLKPTLHRFGLRWVTVEVVRSVLTVLILGSYVAVVGGPASAVRALVMASAFILGRALQRPSNALNSLGAAALVLLLARPGALMDVGFQLSFAAVGAIVMLMPVLERPLPARLRAQPVARYFTRLLLASVAATLGTMSVLLAHFGLFPVAGVVLNVIAIPATAMALAGGLLTVISHGWAASLAATTGAAADLFARVVLETGLRGEDWLGWTAVQVHVTNGLVIAALSIAVLAVSFIPRPRLRWRASSASMACLGAALWLAVLDAEFSPRLQVIFFDVGQGDAAFITFPNGRNLLIDAGPVDPYGDAATRTIIPHLERFRVRGVDVVLVTHPHADHLGGVPALLEAVPIGKLIDNGDQYDSELVRLVEERVYRLGVPTRSLAAGDRISLDPSVSIEVLHPGPEPDAHANDASIVLRITHGDVVFLFAGDVEVAAEATLAARYGSALCADVIKVPHHGSRTSSTIRFVEAVTSCGTSTYAVVSVARRNRYGLPNEEALHAWAVRGVTTLATSEERAVWLTSDGRTVGRRVWR